VAAAFDDVFFFVVVVVVPEESEMDRIMATVAKKLNLYGFIPRSLLRKVLFPDLLESVIPECFYRESRRDRNWTPD
jgi:hypothetical protein